MVELLGAAYSENRTYAGVVEALKTEAVEPKVRKAATYGKSGRRFRPEEERIPLAGLVEHPIVTEAEYWWMQERLLENKRLADKNTRLRQYLLRGLVHCAACGSRYTGATYRQPRGTRSDYHCNKRWNPGPDGQKCRSRSLLADELEKAVFAAVVDFLSSPVRFEAEMQRRRGITRDTVESLRRELESLCRQQKEERDAEARAFRLATRTMVNEDIFDQEIGLIRTRQRWIEEQMERIQGQLDDIERYSFSEKAVELLRQRLETRLTGSTYEDKRFVLESVGAKVMVQRDGSWELELQVPRQVTEPADECQIVNIEPGSIYTLIHI